MYIIIVIMMQTHLFEKSIAPRLFDSSVQPTFFSFIPIQKEKKKKKNMCICMYVCVCLHACVWIPRGN